MQIFPIVNDTKHRPFCGPTAIAGLTGVPVSRIEKMIRRVRGSYSRDIAGRKIPIKGTYKHEVLKVLKRLGCKIEEMKNPESTFGRFVADTAHMNAVFLVRVTGHYMVASRGKYFDTSTLKEGPQPIDGYKRATRRVKDAWRIIAPEAPRFSLDDPISASREPKPKKDIKAVRAERLAKQIEQWEAKERRARNALKRLRPKLRRYQKLGLTP